MYSMFCLFFFFVDCAGKGQNNLNKLNHRCGIFSSSLTSLLRCTLHTLWARPVNTCIIFLNRHVFWTFFRPVRMRLHFFIRPFPIFSLSVQPVQPCFKSSVRNIARSIFVNLFYIVRKKNKKNRIPYYRRKFKLCLHLFVSLPPHDLLCTPLITHIERIFLQEQL